MAVASWEDSSPKAEFVKVIPGFIDPVGNGGGFPKLGKEYRNFGSISGSSY